MSWRVLTIIVLGFLAYGSMLPAPFKTMDDRISIVENPAIKSTASIPEIFRQGYFHDQFYYRPLVNLSYLVEYQLFQLKSFFYNLDNLILHILNALLVFLLVAQLTRNPLIGFWTGLLFAIHPVQWEAVCNIPGRAILMSAFFVLVSFNAFVYFDRRRQWPWLVLSLLAFGLGLLSKESAGVLPGVLFFYLWLDPSRSWAAKLRPWLLFLVVVAAYTLLRHHFGITQMYRAGDLSMWLLGFVTFLRSAITDLRLFILPVDLHFDRCLPFFASFSERPAAEAIIFWSVALIVLARTFRKIPQFILFLMLWFALELFPVSQLVASIGVGTGYISTAEHFLYTAAVPALLVLVLGFRWLWNTNQTKAWVRPAILKFLAGGMVTFWFLIAVEQSIYASDEFHMIQRSLMFEPNNPRVQGSMGLLYVFKNDIPGAEQHFRAAVKAEPLNARYHISLATALCQQKQWVEGLGQYIALDPGNDKALVDREVAVTMGHIEDQMHQGHRFNSREWMILGIYYAKKGGPLMDAAIDAFQRSVKLNPHQADSWLNLGSLYEAKQNWPAAQDAYRHLLALKDLTAFQQKFGHQHLAMVGGH